MFALPTANSPLSAEELDVILRGMNLEGNEMDSTTPETPDGSQNCQDYSNFLDRPRDVSTESKTAIFGDVILGSNLDKVQTSPRELEVTPTLTRKSDWDLVQQMNRYYDTFSKILKKPDDQILQLTPEEWSKLQSELELFSQYVSVLSPDDNKYEKLVEEVQIRLLEPQFAKYWT